ncbi:MAG TPA: DUF2085 domain-containing protein [Anaerolineaceae bacterium]
MINITVYYKDDCPVCDQVRRDLQSIQVEIPHTVSWININNDPQLTELYDNKVPILFAGPYQQAAPITQQEIKVMLLAAQDRVKQLQTIEPEKYHQRVERGKVITRADRISLWLSDHYMLLCNLVVFLYVGLPFLSPIFMKIGAEFPAKAINFIYSPLCHQLGYRSFFLFGEQLYYPRELAGISGIKTYEEVSGNTAFDLIAGRNFYGDEKIGYKISLCQRDIAIYLSVLFFGIIFSLTGKKIKQIPWVLWIVIGLVPIGLDGVSQIPSVYERAPLFFPIRESTPFLRVLTGALFGITSAWFLYPMIAETMRETRLIVLRKIALIHNQRERIFS